MIASGEQVDKASNLQDKLNNDGGSPYTVLLLVHTDQSLQKSLNSNNRFFHNLLRLGEQVYHKEGLTNELVLSEYDPSNTSLDCQMHWHQRYYRAEAFIDAAECIWIDQDESVVLSLIGQAVEQLCLGLIYVFLGYRPKQHSLHHLADLCNNFTREVDHIFPRQTEQDKNVFAVLNKSSSSARFTIKSSVDPTDCSLLHRKARLLLEKSEQIVEQRILTIAKE